MIKLAKQDWDKFLRDNNPEVFNEQQINAWIESNRDLLVKAEGETLSPQDNQFVEDFRTEISHFTKVEVLRPNEDKLQKSLVHEIFYIREQQVEWDEEIIKSEDGQEFSFGTYRETSLNNKLGRVGNLIEKGKRGQVGEIREWKGGKYKKTAQGWVEVSEGKEGKKEATEGKDDKKERNLWIADRADKLAKDHPDKSDDQLLRMAGKEWESKGESKKEEKKDSDKDSQPKGEEKNKEKQDVFYYEIQNRIISSISTEKNNTYNKYKERVLKELKKLNKIYHDIRKIGLTDGDLEEVATRLADDVKDEFLNKQ